MIVCIHIFLFVKHIMYIYTDQCSYQTGLEEQALCQFCDIESEYTLGIALSHYITIKFTLGSMYIMYGIFPYMLHLVDCLWYM